MLTFTYLLAFTGRVLLCAAVLAALVGLVLWLAELFLESMTENWEDRE